MAIGALKLQALCLLSLLLLLLPLLTTSISAFKINTPRLGATRDSGAGYRSDGAGAAFTATDFETFYYDQTIDHFNYQPESFEKFKQRYVINSKYWNGADATAPIIAYMGEESSLDEDIPGIGFPTDNAARFGASLLYIEHRFYGESIPFGSRENALKNATIRGYFNSAQALADYAEVILHVKKILKAPKSPVIVVGGSYGGMLAAWFRLKYPHITIGALASSAPLLYFEKIVPHNGYYRVVTKNFRSCFNTIKNSWSEIDSVAAEANGLSTLSKKFKTCQPLRSAVVLKDYLDSLYSVAAQYDRPPRYPVNVVCNGIDGGSEGTDILGRIFSGLVAYKGQRSCYDLSGFFPSETLGGWDWQTCSDLVITIGRGSNDTMFPAAPFDMKMYNDYCIKKYGVSPRPHWVTTYFGGRHIKLILERFGSNIIFSNGLRDPYSSGGVLQDISDTLLAVSTPKGSHCLDILPARKDDPDWLVMQRKIEIEIIDSWIMKYYEDLLQS